MKILVFGATGSIGRLVIDQALDKGYEVTAFVRNPAKLGDLQKTVHCVHGDVLNPKQVDDALTAIDAVICTLGAGLKGGIRAEGTRNIVRAMEKEGIKRLICLSTLGTGNTRKYLNFYWKYIMFGLLLRKAYADHELQERIVADSDLDWTIVRPGAFTDQDATGHFFTGDLSGKDRLKLKIARADVARFLVEQLTDITWLKKRPAITA